MMEMPRPRPPHLHREVSRHGKAAWYVRIGKGKRIRIRAAFGTPEFDAQYQAALSGSPRSIRGTPAAGSLNWLVARYRETALWQKHSLATRRQRENIFLQVTKSAGQAPCSHVTSETIIAGRGRRAKTPHQARHFLDAMRGLFRWATEAKLVKRDPTIGVDNPPRKMGQGFPSWNEADAEAYEKHWPLGTKERVWLDVLCFTGARRGDAVVLGRQHVRDGVLTFRTMKSGEEVEVTIPILPVLAQTLAAGPCGDLAFICGANGRPLTKESFGNAFSEAARKAGVNKSAHGVRKIAATRCADNGATVHQLMALFGWKSPSMAEVYTQDADRRRLAREAAHMLVKLVNENRTSIPAPEGAVRAPKKKAQ